MGRTRIPDNVKGFNSYMSVTGAYLFEIDETTGLLNWQRLGISEQIANAWRSKCSFWIGTLYPKYSSIDLRTKTVTAQARGFRRAFSKFGNPVLEFITWGRNTTVRDEVVFNFSRTRNTGRRRTAIIREQCLVKLIHKGSCYYLIKCSTESNGRARKPKGANQVLMHYKIVNHAPISAAERVVNETWKLKCLPNARQVFKTGSENKGKLLLAAFQWNYSRKPHLAGPLSEVQAMLIV